MPHGFDARQTQGAQRAHICAQRAHINLRKRAHICANERTFQKCLQEPSFATIWLEQKIVRQTLFMITSTNLNLKIQVDLLLWYAIVVISYYCRPLAQSIFERLSWYFDSDIMWNCKYIWIKVQPAQPRPLFPLFPEGWEGPQGSWDLDSTAGALNSGRLGLWAWRGRHSGFLSFSQPEAQWNPQKKSGYARCAALWLLFCQWFGWCFFRRQLQ